MDKNKLAKLVEASKEFDFGLKSDDLESLFNAIMLTHVGVFNAPAFVPEEERLSMVMPYFATIVRLSYKVTGSFDSESLCRTYGAKEQVESEVGRTFSESNISLESVKYLDTVATYIDRSIRGRKIDEVDTDDFNASLLTLSLALIISYEERSGLKFIDELERRLITLGLFKQETQEETQDEKTV